MRVRICHKTRFEYERPAYDSHNEIRLHPWSRATQHCGRFDLIAEPAAAILSYRDFFGNHGHALSVAAPHHSLTIVARSTVEVTAPPIQLDSGRVLFSQFLAEDVIHGRRFCEFLGPSRFVPFSERLRKFFWMGARPGASEDLYEYVMRVIVYVRAQFAYEKTTTHVHSSVNDILKTGGGVCQDFAHLAIGILRLAGIPSRYVSGYLAPAHDQCESPLNEQATHAWLEAWLPDAGWSGFDPTHGSCTDERHIGMATGRDYGDVPPIRGTYQSQGSNSAMKVELNIETVPDDNSRSSVDIVAAAKSQQ